MSVCSEAVKGPATSDGFPCSSYQPHGLGEPDTSQVMRAGRQWSVSFSYGL